jgi:hypothetical protein
MLRRQNERWPPWMKLARCRPGEGRTKAMRKARILRNAAEIHEHFFGKSGAPVQIHRSRIMTSSDIREKSTMPWITRCLS